MVGFRATRGKAWATSWALTSPSTSFTAPAGP